MVNAGDLFRATDIPALTTYIIKAASEPLTSNTTLQDDDDIVWSLEASKVYKVELHAGDTGATGGDVKLAWAVTGGAAIFGTRSCIGPATATTDATDTNVRSTRQALTTAVPYGTDGTNTSSVRETFIIETTTAGTAGTLKLQWAQNASSGTATTLTTSTMCFLTEIEAA